MSENMIEGSGFYPTVNLQSEPEPLETPEAQPWRWSHPAGAIFAALAKAQAEIKGALKDSENPYFRSRYADLASVVEACGEALAKNGIAVVQMPVNAGDDVGVVTLLGHESGQWIESRVYVQPTKFDAQSVGSVITYLRRYALAAMARVAPEDDDGEAAVGRPAGTLTGRTAPPQRPQNRAPTRTAGNGAQAAIANQAWHYLGDLIRGADRLEAIHACSPHAKDRLNEWNILQQTNAAAYDKRQLQWAQVMRGFSGTDAPDDEYVE